MHGPSVFAATDLSADSRLVVRRAQHVSRVLERPFILAHVVGDFSVNTSQTLIPSGFGTKVGVATAGSGSAALSAAAARTTTKLERWLDDARVKPDATRVLVGGTHTALLAAAKAAKASLIVTGAHRGRSKAKARLLGTTSDKLLRNSRVPVLLARTEVDRGYRRVLIGLDLGPTMLHVIHAARDLAPMARFDLVHVLPAHKNGDLQHEHDLRIARKLLKDAAAAAKLPDGRWRISLPTGDPCEALLATAEKLEPDLIVLGTRANKGVKRLLLGSTAESVLREATTDVLAVPPTR